MSVFWCVCASAGVLHDVYYQDLTIRNVGTTVVVNMDYGGAGTVLHLAPPHNLTEYSCTRNTFPHNMSTHTYTYTELTDDDHTSLQIRNIYFSNITVSNTGNAGQLDCVKASPCHSFEFTDFVQTGVKQGWSCKEVFGNVGSNVKPKPCLG